mgnify:CR=1 FL=1
MKLWNITKVTNIVNKIRHRIHYTLKLHATIGKLNLEHWLNLSPSYSAFFKKYFHKKRWAFLTLWFNQFMINQTRKVFMLILRILSSLTRLKEPRSVNHRKHNHYVIHSKESGASSCKAAPTCVTSSGKTRTVPTSSSLARCMKYTANRGSIFTTPHKILAILLPNINGFLTGLPPN